jgi:hypothetical protein
MQPLLVWLLASLMAIALMGSRPYLALAVVVVGGIAMGLSSLWSCQTRGRGRSQEDSPTAGGE